MSISLVFIAVYTIIQIPIVVLLLLFGANYFNIKNQNTIGWYILTAGSNTISLR